MLTAGEYCRGSEKAFIEVAMLCSYYLKIVLTGVDTAGTDFFIEEIGLCNHATGDHACRGKWIIRKKRATVEGSMHSVSQALRLWYIWLSYSWSEYINMKSNSHCQGFGLILTGRRFFFIYT